MLDESIKVFYHMAKLNGIIFELESTKVKIDDDNEMLKLIWSILDSYKYIKTNPDA